MHVDAAVSFPGSVIYWAALTAPASTSGTGETVLMTTKIPANTVAVGSSFRVLVAGLSSATGTLLFRTRIGANGTTADAQVWIGTTSVAQVANSHAGYEVIVTIRSIGAGGTAIADGAARAGAVLVPTLIGAAATASVNTTTAWFLTITCACSVGTFTAQVATVESLCS